MSSRNINNRIKPYTTNQQTWENILQKKLTIPMNNRQYSWLTKQIKNRNRLGGGGIVRDNNICVLVVLRRSQMGAVQLVFLPLHCIRHHPRVLFL